MKKEITMVQYGLTEAVKKSTEHFADFTVSRVVSQEKGLYRPVSTHGEKRGEVSGRFLYGKLARQFAEKNKNSKTYQNQQK